MCWVMTHLIFVLFLARTNSKNQTCKLIGQTGFVEFSKEGDIIIGGVFSISRKRTLIDNGYRKLPNTYCEQWNDRELKSARTVIFTVEEINRDKTILPGVSLGYRLYDGCGNENVMRAAIEALNGKNSKVCRGPVVALLGHSTSGLSKDINYVLSPLSVPQVSHFATCACLSDKRLFPTFFRTVPSDRFQMSGLAQLMKYFDWRWVGIIHSEELYAMNAVADFSKEAAKEAVCVEYKLIYSDLSQITAKFETIVETLRESSSKVVLLFMSLFYTKAFLSTIENYNVTGKQWVGAESWITQADLASVNRKNILQGAMGLALPQAPIPGLGEFLLSLKPSDEPQSTIIKAIWEKFFDCSFSPSNTSALCTGTEDLRTVSSDYTDVTHFRPENNVYKAVYLVAYALHALLQCENGSNPQTGKPCVNKDEVQPELLLEHIKYVNFTTRNGAKVFFDENGDSVAQYDLVNWQMEEDGSVHIVNIGQYDTSFPEGKKLKLKDNATIFWQGNSIEVSHFATCACLSDKRLYPTFFRTVPSDRFQISGLVQLMKYFDWRWVGIIHSEEMYSVKGIDDFTKEAAKEAVCIEYRLTYSDTSQITSKFEDIVETLRESTSQVVLLFMSLYNIKSFLSKIENYNMTGKQWIGSETWITQADLASVNRKNILQGAMGFALPQASIPGLGEFLLSLKPSDEPQSTIIKAIWEKFFNCSFSPSNTSALCTGTEDLRTVSSHYTDVTHFRPENSMYKAVYVVAYAVHALLQCENGSNPQTGKPCVNKNEVQPEQVLEHIKYVNFTTRNGAKVFFDENGDSVAQYDLINWQMEEDGSVQTVNIGRYDTSFSEGNTLKLKDNATIIWQGNSIENQTCKLLGRTGFMEFSQLGDVDIGGVFSISSTRKMIDHGYQKLPHTYCERWNDRELKFARTAIFTVEEINRDETLLPGVSLGYRLYDGCGDENMMRAAIEALNGKNLKACRGPVVALIGHSSSGISKDINFIFSTLSVPQVSHFATCACLSDKRLHPTFFRTVPSDRFQTIGLVQLMKYFDWRWIGVISSHGMYSMKGTDEFIKEAKKEGICVEYRLPYSETSQENLDSILETLRKSSSKVVLLFMSLFYTKSFLSKIEHYNVTGKQWIGSESWIAQADLASVNRKNILQGAMGFALPQASIPGLGEFLLSLKPSDEPHSTTIKAIWEKFFDCSFSPSNTSALCTGTEDLRTVSSDYTDVTHFRPENNVYKAVYLVAYALHALLQCENGSNPQTGKPCVNKNEVQPEQLLEHIKYVNFTTRNGAKVFFDENGDSVAQYDLVNWQMEEDGSVHIVNIGQYDTSFPEGKKLKLKDNATIIWEGNSIEVSYFSTCACLSDREKYPTFFRTIPSDYFQAKALAALVNHFGWQWIGAIQSDNDYGRNGILAFTKEVEKLGVCISFVGTVLRTYPKDKILKVVETIKTSTVKVIMAFVPEGDLYPLMKEVVKQNITGIQWIASEAWITAHDLSTPEIYQAFGGALGFVMQKMAIPDLKPYLTAINPYTDPNAAFVKDFWEIMVGCKPFSPVQLSGTEATNEICTGNETLMNSQDMFFNVTQLRVSYNVYKAVYAIAHALHHLVFCHPVGKKQARPCLNISEIQPEQVTEHLQKVNFTDEFGGNVFFDTNGDPPASYDIINWQLRDGQVQHVTLGHFASDANGDYKLSIQEDKIVWRTGNVVSYFSTCACLSDRAKYPTFFRTIPSDYFQAKALAALVHHFGWQWIGAIQSDNDYGRNGILAFTKEVEKLGVCISFVGTVLRTYPKDKILDVVEMIKMSTVKVIMAFVPEGDLYPLMKEVVKQNITGIQWIASEAWITAPSLSTPAIYHSVGGALGFVMQKMAIPDLKPYLTAINPYTDPSAAFVKDFWEIMVGCKPFSPVQLSDTEATNEICTGNETLMNSQDMFFNVTQLRVSYNVYKAVYAIAHALHHLVFCHPVGKKQVRPCLNISEIQPKQVTEHLQKVNFTDEFGGNVFFDTNGDPPASYDIINWQLRDGQVQHVTLGHFASDANGDYKLSIQEDKIVWRTGNVVNIDVLLQFLPDMP
ncbi:uncharacterized protein V6R79_001236 [Siganus canaliculatus]